ncbi:MAG: hypothetical protein K8S16_19315 [Bacteroidales bacterium]|nr:hypothetical protein [Bacteroidales bacterium]
MTQNNRWTRSDLVALIALAISITVGLFTAIEFFSNRNETIKVKRLNNSEKRLHVYEVTKTRNNNVFVSQVAEWQKIRIGNKSNFPITITDSYIKVDNKIICSTLKPFFKKVTYGKLGIEISNPVILPLTIEANNVEEFYFLLNIPVDPLMGMAFLITSWDTTYLSNESSLFSLISNKSYFSDFEELVNSQLDSSAINEVLHIQTNFRLDDEIKIRRPLIIEKDEHFELLDKYNQYYDGFIYVDKSKCLYEINELLLRNNHPIQTTFKKIEICFKTLRENEYKVKFKSNDFWK